MLCPNRAVLRQVAPRLAHHPHWHAWHRHAATSPLKQLLAVQIKIALLAHRLARYKWAAALRLANLRACEKHNKFPPFAADTEACFTNFVDSLGIPFVIGRRQI